MGRYLEDSVVVVFPKCEIVIPCFYADRSDLSERKTDTGEGKIVAAKFLKGEWD